MALRAILLCIAPLRVPGTPAAFAAEVSGLAKKWSKVIREANVKAE
jgi:hypothetical protein